MKIPARKMITAGFFGLGFAVSIIALTDHGHAQNKSAAGKEILQSAVAPFIVQDTDNDSPGTNNVTRIVTITAEVGGTPPIALQWKVDHGHGFKSIAGATNAIFRIGNAQIADSGLYALFATNSAGGIHTTPVPLTVIEVED
jgi:hypothetical protein